MSNARDTAKNLKAGLNVAAAGSIIDVQKANSTVGQISNIGNDFVVGSPTGSGAGLRFDGTNNMMYASNSLGNARDNAVDLGASSVRFKDLYLGGGAYIGGTGAANKLSDYETGTWTPTAAQGASSITIGAGTPVYVKIGSFVHVQVYVTGSSGSNSSQLWIGGLPFTPIGSALNAGVVMYQNITLSSGRTNLVAYIPAAMSHIRMYQGGNNVGWHGTTGSNVGNSFNAIISISYRTSA